MELDLKDIIEAQQILDKVVHQRHNVTYSKIIEELKLALFVELGELANEVRSFKFWSIKNASEKKVILEEYVDGIHFIGSLSIAHDIKPKFILNDTISILNKKDLTIAFNRLFKSMEVLNTSSGIKEWFTNYLLLGYQLGFTYDEIHQAYFEKNQINFKRQEENY